MAWVRVESSVPRHRKFLKAGPAPSWLWLCGLAYCQEGQTDGFIPFEALPMLGVPKSAHRLAASLVAAGLWETAEGGWRIHAYLEHNRSSEEIEEIKDKRREYGKLGGRPRKASVKANEKPDTFTPQNPSVVVAASVAAAVPVLKEGGLGETADPFGVFHGAYPVSRRKGGYRVETLFSDALTRYGQTLASLLEALDNHTRSEQWQSPKLIPGMDVWLEEKRWNQRLDPPSSVGTTSRTAGNVEAARRFIERGGAA